jgi:Permuted papain-like amidase enzyme, YaeF/YiiX, C92 family
MKILIRISFLLIVLISCNTKTKPLIKEEQIKQTNSNILDSCKSKLQRGDLILRMGDDFISQILADLSPHEKMYSHAGIVEVIDGKPFVYNINPPSTNMAQDDTIRLEPVDTFLNPLKNKAMGLYRYNISKEMMAAFIDTINVFKKQKVRFDMRFDITNDDTLYCSEIIVKALERASHGAIQFPRVIIDSTRVLGVKRFFKVMNNEIDLKKYPILTLDNLYLSTKAQKIYTAKFLSKNNF